MSNQNNVYLALRISALFIILISYSPPLEFFLMYLESFGEFSSYTFELWAISVSSIPLFIGIYLWFRAKKLTPLFVTESFPMENSDNEYTTTILRLACIILGLYLVINNLPYLVSAYLLYSGKVTEFGLLGQLDASFLSSLVQSMTSQVIAIIFGISLILGSNILAHLLGKARTFGIEK